ncbi:MAG TPA: AAA family ATPase [Solirubrobacteraceae bacterium]
MTLESARRGSVGAVSTPPLAGRQAELATLRSALSEADAGRPTLLVLSGDAGIGKSRLVRELEAVAREMRGLALHGQCLELSRGELPYAPIASALRSVETGELAGALARLPEEARRDLARAFPDAVGEAPAETVSEDPFGQSRLFGWLLSLLRHLSTDALVLLSVEDIHQADTSSRDFLRFLAQSLRSERLLVIVSVRSDELHREHPARTLVSELTRLEGVSRLELHPLSEADIRSQVQSILDQAPPPGLIDRLYARTQGNPFYAEELLAASVDGRESLPISLQDALLQRSDRLGDSARTLLRLAAAAGRPLGEGLIARASGLSGAELELALRQCIDHRVLVCDRRTGDYNVRHALLAEAVYADLLPVERASLHRRLAAALSEPPAGAAGERARHWELAGEPGRAVLASIEAGTGAERIFGYGEALAHFLRADDLWDRDPAAAGTAPLDRVDLLTRAARAARWMGDSDTACALCTRALETFDHAEDPLRAAHLLERLGRYQPWNVEQSLEAFQRGLSLLPGECPAERMRFYVDEALELSFSGRWEDARTKAETAIQLAQGQETLASESAARALLGTAIAFLGDPVAGERDLRHALILAQQAGSTEELVQIYLDLGEVLRLQGRIAEALGVMLEGEAAAVARGALPFANFMAANAADDLLRLGRWDELAGRLTELGRRELDRPAALLRESVAGRLDTARGQLEAAEAHFTTAMELCQDLDLVEFVPAVYSGVAELELWRGRPERARELLAEGLEKLGPGENLLHIPSLHSTGARVEADRAELARARREEAAAEQAIALAQAHHDRLAELLVPGATASTPPEAAAHLATCAAELGRALGRPDPEGWEASAALWRGHGNLYRIAYAEFRHAEALVSTRGPRPHARAALQSALELCAQLGAEQLSAEARRLARRARLSVSAAGAQDPPAAGDAGTAAGEREENPFSLTQRELEVLRLLGSGLTNREISEALFISQHTAGVHVSHILGKLGVANRAMAAAVAERLGLVPRG